MNFIDIALASKLNGDSGGAVSSVNGKTGNVVLTGADLAFSDSTTYPEGSIGHEINNLKEDSNDFIVTFNGSTSNEETSILQADKTITEILEAYNNHKNIIFQFAVTGDNFLLGTSSSNYIITSHPILGDQCIVNINIDSNPSNADILVGIVKYLQEYSWQMDLVVLQGNLDAGSISYDSTEIYNANTIGKTISDINSTIANVPQIDNQNEIVLFNKTGLTNGSSFAAEFDYQTIFPTTTEGSIDVQVEYDNKVYNCIALYNQVGYERNSDALESDVFVIIGDLVGYYVSKSNNVESFYNFPFQIILGPTKTLSTVTCYFKDNQSHNVKLLLPASQLLKRQYLDTASYVYNGTGKKSTREGICTAALDECAHAEGFYTVAADYYAHTEGDSTIACYGAHAEGFSSEAIGNFSHAEGHSVAKGDYSHSEGFASETQGDYCHVEGLHTIAKGVSQHVFGEYNIEDPANISDPTSDRGTYVEIVGNGTSSNARSNARTLDWSGNEILTGNLQVGGNITFNGNLTFNYNGTSYTLTPADLVKLLSI